MKRLTLNREQILTVITAMAVVYDDCKIIAEMHEDTFCNGVYELVPLRKVDGMRIEEARTLISNTGTYHRGVLLMLCRMVSETTGEAA